MSTGQARTPVVLGAGEGEARWFLQNRTLIKATAESTGGAYGLLESWVPPGASPPLHVHYREDEIFWVLEGELTIRCGERTFGAGPGCYIALPRGVPHTFVVEGDANVHMLTLLSPGGGERFFVEAGRPAEGPGLPPEAPLDLAALERIAHRFGMAFVGAPLRPSREPAGSAA